MKKKIKILLLEDSKTDAELIQRTLLKEMECEFNLAMDEGSFLSALQDFSPEVILSDHSLPQFNSSNALDIAKLQLPNVPFIMVTGAVSEEFAAKIIKQGADDYILKDRMARLPAAITAALKQRQAMKEIKDYKYALDESAIVDISDQKGIIKYASNNFCKISKFTSHELIGSHYQIMSSGHHPASYFTELWETINAGKIWRGEFCNKAKDETLFWVDTTIIPFLNDKKKPYQYLSIRTDITEKKKSDEELRKSEIRLNEAQAIAHISSWEIDIVNDVTTWSDEFYKILGLNKETSKPSLNLFLSRIHPEDAFFAQQKTSESFTSPIDSSLFFRFIRTDESVRHGYAKWKFELNDSGKPLRLYGILQDVTERKQAEEELRKVNERFQFATKASSDIIWELNFETKSYLIYEGKEKLFASDKTIDWKSGIEGKYIFDEDREKVRDSFKAARIDLTRQLWELEYRVLSVDASIMHIVNHAIFIRNESGKALRAIGAITDITEKKKLEENLLEQQRLQHLKITATALEAQEKERIAIGIELHDNVNQILVGTNLILSMIKSKPDKISELVASSMANLQEAIQENRKIAHVFVAPDLKTESLVEQLKRLVINMLKNSGIKTKMNFDNFHEEFLDDEKKINIYRIAQEQFTNIVKYAKASAVHMTLYMNDTDFKMIIEDNGVGMDTTKKTTGIGLRNIEGRLSIFNGTTHIVSAPGKGFSLEITMPGIK